MEATARRGWELDNNIHLVDPARDSLYTYSDTARKELEALHPWRSDPSYFRTVRISAIALLKMVIHAREGGSIEIMGLMQGFVNDTSLIITDAFRLPVEGTETRVNAQDEANEYIVEYPRLSREEGSRMENIVGWYHSHPGYGCWLSGIDVGTQHNWQSFNDPFVAVVVDPDRTVSAGQVEIGAFRTYPENYKPPSASAAAGTSTTDGGGGVAPDGYQAVPLAKAEDFGAHADRYYSLEVEHFKSTLDEHLLALLWNKYWVQTLSQNPLLTNRDYGNKQLLDLASKVNEATASVAQSSRSGGGPSLGGVVLGGSDALVVGGGGGVGAAAKRLDGMIDKVVKASDQVAAKEKAGLMAIQVKAKIFNGLGTASA